MKTLFSTILVFHFIIIQSQSAFVDSVNHSLRNLQENEKTRHLYKLADEHADINPRESIWIAEEGLSLAYKQKAEVLQFDFMMLLGDLSLDVQDFSYGDSMYHLAIKFAENSEDDHMILKAKYGLAKCLSYQGKWPESIVMFEKIYLKAVEVGDSLMQARALMAKGLNHEKMADYETSLKFYFEALPFYEALDDQYRLGLIHTNIGMSLMRLNRNEEALKEFQTAYQISVREDDLGGIRTTTLNIGVAHQKLGNYDFATEAFEKALVMARAAGSWYDIALLNANLGTVAMQQKRYREARTLLERACVIKDSIGYQHDLPHTLNSLAKVNIHLGEYETALAKAEEAALLSLRYKKRDQLSESHRVRSEIFAAQGHYQLAYDHMLRHKQISDSIFNESSDKAISNLKIQYETTLKENQITELTAKNKRNRIDKLLISITGILILITGASLIYALYHRRLRDKIILTKERELHELQNQFFTNISHEFRTPLTLILGPLHSLRRKWKGTNEDHILRIVQKSGERLLLLINQILDLAKFDMKVLELKKENFNATRSILGICSSFDSLAESRNIQYAYDINDQVILHADMRRLEIVLTNLISNAFKFTPDHGSICVTAKTNKTIQNFTLQVKDSGKGIAEEKLSKIFDRYYHDDREAHSDFEGAGIGLALSKHIIEMHGGKITVESIIHEGSNFTVSLPYVTGLVPVQDPGISNEDGRAKILASDGSQSEPVQKSIGEKPIVLLVEDRGDMREYIKSLLIQTYHVIEAPDAFEGWTKALEHIPDVVISDVMMPRKSGLELCTELKSDLRTSHIPVLLLTAKSSPEDRLSGLEKEADVYLTKPFIPQELELHLRNLVASRKKIREFYTHHRHIEPSKMSFNSLDEQFLQSFIEHLDKYFADESFSVEQLADLMHLSRSQLHRKLIALTGQAPNRIIRTYRLKRAYDMIISHAATVAEISYSVGFGSPAYFTKCFVEEFGATPVEIRERAVKV